MQILSPEQWVVSGKEKNTDKKGKKKKISLQEKNRINIKIFQCAKEKWVQNKSHLFASFIPKVLSPLIY